MDTEYVQQVLSTIKTGNYEQNRTDVDTISSFGRHYRTQVTDEYPLLTTKKMFWNSLLREVEWYLSGDHHIKTLKEHTGVWNDWADDDWNLPTAYGRFWRRFPVPDQQLQGEWWVTDDEWFDTAAELYDVSESELQETVNRWLTVEDNDEIVVDQLQYVVDTLNGDNPMRPPQSRRLVVSAWHPGNAVVSRLPPCHYTFLFNVQGDTLNLHMTQRSADMALGVPFNIGAYTLLLKYVAQLTGYTPGVFSHALGDAHIYCGKGKRGAWYDDNLTELQSRVSSAASPAQLRSVREWILEAAPDELDAAPSQHQYGYDHIPGLLEQCAREPRPHPTVEINAVPLNEFSANAVNLTQYDSAEKILFGVAE